MSKATIYYHFHVVEHHFVVITHVCSYDHEQQKRWGSHTQKSIIFASMYTTKISETSEKH